MFETRESFGIKAHSNSRYLEFETCEQANLAFDILKKLQEKEAAQQSAERTADEDGEKEVNPYLLSGAELARAEAAARSR